MIRTAIFTLALAATLFAGCGSDERDQAAAAAGPAPKTDTDGTASKARSSAPKKASAARRGVCWAGSPRWLQQFAMMLTD